jgi:hypothetical protein
VDGRRGAYCAAFSLTLTNKDAPLLCMEQYLGTENAEHGFDSKIGVSFSVDGAILALAPASTFFAHTAAFITQDQNEERGVQLVSTENWREESVWRHKDYSTGSVVHHEQEGWLAATSTGIRRMVDGTVLVPGFAHDFALIPKVGLVKAVFGNPDGAVFLVTCPDVVAMRAMSAERVQWMAVVARGIALGRFFGKSSFTKWCNRIGHAVLAFQALFAASVLAGDWRVPRVPQQPSM